MESERSRISILIGWQQFKISSTYFQPSLTASTPSSDPLAIPVKKGENFLGAALKRECHFEGEHIINNVFQFYFMFLMVLWFWVCYVKTLWFKTHGFVLLLKHLWYFGLLIFKVVISVFYGTCLWYNLYPCCFCKLLGFFSMCFVDFYGLCHAYAAFFDLLPSTSS